MVQVFGCFAMTEMGHGSFLRGLETTATYDAATEEFTIHTPSVSATKWWIGGAGQTATHAAVFAQMILPSGENVGVHTFIVQIRSLEDHKPMPGVRLGDCGHKMGRNGLDNGWIQFDHVRVGRDALLSKYVQFCTKSLQFSLIVAKPLQAKIGLHAFLSVHAFAADTVK